MPKTTVLIPLIMVISSMTLAAPLFPNGAYPELDATMQRHGRQFYFINALPFGLSLDSMPKDDAARELFNQFLAQDESDDFVAVTGSHPYELHAWYGEYGDLGFFGGVAVAGTVYEYLTLKRDQASPELVTRARKRLVRAVESWHVFKVVTGGGGLVARGIQKVKSNEGEPVYPATHLNEIVPLQDDNGMPLPEVKTNGTWRADNSGGLLPEGTWVWSDSCSKDQLLGQVFAMTAMYDAIKDDPDMDQSMLDVIADDALKIAQMLMTKRDISEFSDQVVGSGIYDLIIMDADGRPTMYHDLSPYSLEKVYVDPEQGLYNLFNTIVSVGILKGLHHVTGDPDIEQYLYNELLYERDFLAMLENWTDPLALNYIYAGTMTNFDNPDLTSVALWLALYHETDEQVRAVLHSFLEDAWWNRENESHTARLCKQPLWHAIYLTLTNRGTDSVLIQELADLLSAFELGPYWDVLRINCDADEAAAGECLAVDGKTTLVINGTNDNGVPMAAEALDPSIRAPSNFNARSNPFVTNGGGSNRLNPGGDLLASYWIARYMGQRGEGEVSMSPFARVHMPVGGWPDQPDPGPEPGLDVVMAIDVSAEILGSDVVDAVGNVDVVAPDTTKKKSKGGCQAASSGAGLSLLMLLVLLSTLAGIRRRKMVLSR
jgi:MYXO-CTERM domain-containing protein